MQGILAAWLCWSQAVAEDIESVRTSTGKIPGSALAIPDVCAWPNLTRLSDGSIIATIHNQPGHLTQPADVDCWGSSDGGKTWILRGTPAPRDQPQYARGNVAAGVNRQGDLIVIASGWNDPVARTHGTVLAPVVSLSRDGGKSWEIHHDSFPGEWPREGVRAKSPEGYLIPFGDILPGQDGSLLVCMYGGSTGATHIYRSEDDGRAWKIHGQVDPSGIVLEPAFLHLGEGHWLLASRHQGLTMYTSADNGRTWTKRERLSEPNAHPGHLLTLQDGSILLSYGNRNLPRGIDVRLSRDRGQTWSSPRRITGFVGDGGYPASVQLPDGQILTAYYASTLEGDKKYHMSVVTWSVPDSWNLDGQ